MKKLKGLFFLFILYLNCISYREEIIEIDLSRLSLPENVKHHHLLAGVSVVDITPPPGMPLAGYSLNAETAKGFRHKLKARTLVITNRNNRTIVLIKLDLLSGSLLLHHKLAEIIGKKYNIFPSDILMAGTHTHAGPGNYFESNFYNQYAANKGGFENVYFDFLLEQIQKSVDIAFQNRIPVKITMGRKAIYGYTKNRSFLAYLKNQDVQKKIITEEAINPWVEMIRIDTLKNQPFVVFTNFSIHPTVIPEDNIFYHRDVFGYIEKGLEDMVKEKYQIDFFIHLALNYTHGDATPNYDDKNERGDFVIAKEIGYGIAKEMFDLYHSLKDFQSDIILDSYAKEIDMFQENQIGEVFTCNYPVIGMALMTGATTRQTPILKHLPFYRPGWPRWIFTKNCQGEKRWFLSILQPFFFNKEDFPHLLYFQAIQIGNFIYLTFPFEITERVGYRIKKSINEIYKNYNIIPISCANGYTGYVTTPEEYSLQYYEGGHNLYGKNTGNFLMAISKNLIEKLFDKTSTDSEIKNKYNFRLKSNKFIPDILESSVNLVEIHKPEKIKNIKENFIKWVYKDSFYSNLSQISLKIQQNQDCNSKYVDFMDEESLSLSLHIIKFKNNEVIYEARWYFIDQDIKSLKNSCFRFGVIRKNQSFYSSEFKIQ